jgi:hypothetical protein
MPLKKSIAGHVRLLGILWLVDAAFHVSPALALMAFFNRRFMPPDIPPFVYNFFPFISGILLFTGIAAGIVGIGLLTRQSWARIAAIIVGALNLWNFPFGTALGFYTLWVLTSAEHEAEYRHLTGVA